MKKEKEKKERKKEKNEDNLEKWRTIDAKWRKKENFAQKIKQKQRNEEKKHMDLPWDQLIAFNKIPESRNTTYIFTYIYTHFYKLIRIFELWIKKRIIWTDKSFSI